jgi:serine/threonine protein kinase
MPFSQPAANIYTPLRLTSSLDVLTVTNAVAGVRFGPYSIIEKIGSGGMGEVYRALNTRLDREVALKLVSERT